MVCRTASIVSLASREVAERFRSSLRKNAAETHAFSGIVQPPLPLRRIGRFEQMQKLVAVQIETSLALFTERSRAS